MKISNLFFSPRQQRLFGLLCLATFFNLGLLAGRFQLIHFDCSAVSGLRDLMFFEEESTFAFLVTNLFLAWMPFLICLFLKPVFERTHSLIATGVVVTAWLLFFPNAPYIITDLIHLKPRPYVPLWYDAVLIFSFAWTGLMVGFASLLHVQTFLRWHLSRRLAWTFSITTLLLGGFGIYMGRFQRWHSWHILTQPDEVLTEIFGTLTHPMVYANTLGMAVILSTFLVIGYLTLHTLIEDRNE